MSRLTTEEKLRLVLELTKKHNITAYEIGSNTELDSSAVHRILTGEVKKPRDRTLSIILEYIENKIVGTEVRDTQSKYSTREKDEGNSLNIDDLIVKKVRESLTPVLANMKNEIIKEIKNMDIEISRLRAVQEELLHLQKATKKSIDETQKGVEAIEHKL